VNNTTGNGNTANGYRALSFNTSGNDNIAVGHNALNSSTTGSANIALGLNAGSNVTTASNVICIGAIGADESNSCFIGNIFDQTSSGGTAVFVNSQGKLGTATSSRRFKNDIKPMENASEALFALKPVTFRYKTETANTPQFGLIAEEVAEITPELVVRDKDGKPYTVRYEAVNAMLLNEFLKEHKQVQAQQATITKLKSTVAQRQKRFARQEEQIQALTSGLQKVSAKVEMTKPVTRIVGNKR
jgi:trimeric autotransporter adhesin